MSPRAPDVPENVRQFAPKEGPPRSDGDPLDQAGQAIVVLVQHASNLSNETCDRAMGQARKSFASTARRRGPHRSIAGGT